MTIHPSQKICAFAVHITLRNMRGSELARYNAMMAEQLHALRWRFRTQEPCWIALEALADKNLLKMDVLQSAAITWNAKTGEIDRIVDALEGFELIQKCLDLNAEVDLEGHFRSPVLWFAVIIYCCCTDINRTHDYLSTTRICRSRVMG